MICSQWIPVREKTHRKPFKKTQFPGRTTIQRIFQYAEFRNWINFMEIFFSFWFLSFDFDQDNFHFDVKHFSFWLLLKSHKCIYFFLPEFCCRSIHSSCTQNIHLNFFLEFECVNAHKLFGFSLQNDNKTHAFKFHFCSFKEKKQHTKLFSVFLLWFSFFCIKTFTHKHIIQSKNIA